MTVTAWKAFAELGHARMVARSGVRVPPGRRGRGCAAAAEVQEGHEGDPHENVSSGTSLKRVIVNDGTSGMRRTQ